MHKFWSLSSNDVFGYLGQLYVALWLEILEFSVLQISSIFFLNLCLNMSPKKSEWQVCFSDLKSFIINICDSYDIRFICIFYPTIMTEFSATKLLLF